jgi:ubiquinone/menaquinone biosynthesis C-methylase UbiE
VNLFQMRGSWRPWNAWLYQAVVASHIAPLYARLADALDANLDLRGRVLDVGCGPGQLAAMLARRHPGCQFLGVDLSETMIGLARRLTAGLPNLTFRAANAEALPFADGEFDLAISITSVKHWADRQAGVREMARVVRPGGRVFVLELDRELDQAKAEGFVRRWPRVLRLLGPFLAFYFRKVVAAQGLDLATLRDLLQAAGLEEVAAQADGEGPIVYAHGRRA